MIRRNWLMGSLAANLIFWPLVLLWIFSDGFSARDLTCPRCYQTQPNQDILFTQGWFRRPHLEPR